MPAAERAAISEELDPPFVIHQPSGPLTPFVFCSPHSGRIYPKPFLRAARLDAHGLRKSEDCFVDELFLPAAAKGAPLIAARFPRAYLDLNREPYELDPRLFHELLPEYANAHSTRVIGGLGTIARIVADGEEIYRTAPSLAAALARIELLYKPFHAALECLITDAAETFGFAVLIDCHSMPSVSMASSAGQRPDFVLGDRFGASCDGALTAFIKEALERRGYHVQVNRPYAGGFITEHYGRPANGIMALQIEVNRGLYVNEKTLERTRGFAALSRDLEYLTERLFCEFPSLMGQRTAAE